MSSLVTLGFYNVALVSNSAIPSSSPISRRSHRAFFKSVTQIAPESSSISAPETRSSLIEHGQHEEEKPSMLRSVLSIVVALVMTIGIQGAPSSRDTFEDVPQTLSGKTLKNITQQAFEDYRQHSSAKLEELRGLKQC